MSITFDVTTRRGRERVREVFTGRKVISLSPDDLVRARTAGYEPDGDHLIGRDPREMAREELEAMGHEPVSPVQAIRLKRLDCCAGSADEVRNCVAMACPSWPRLPPPARRTRLQREPKTLDPPRPPATPAASFDGELGCPSSDTATEQYARQ